MEGNGKKKFYKRWWFWAIVIIVVIMIGSSGGDSSKNTTNTSNSLAQRNTNTSSNSTYQNSTSSKPQTETKKEDPKTFKDSCKSYTYKEIARNPDKYNGKNVKFTGKVVQVSEGYFNSVTIRLNVTRDEYGFYDDTIYCDYTYSSGESKILEDDIITIYGTCKGSTSYTSVLGANITLPKVDVKYVTIKE